MLDQLERSGKVTPIEIAAPITGAVWGYRRRARLGAKHVPKKGGVLVGFRERESSFLATLDSCQVVDPRVGVTLREPGALIGSLSLHRQVPQIEVACSHQPVALVFRALARPTDDDVEKSPAYAYL